MPPVSGDRPCYSLTSAPCLGIKQPWLVRARTPGHHAPAGNTSHYTASASKSSIRRFVITEKAPTRAFSWLKAATTAAFTFKTLC